MLTIEEARRLTDGDSDVTELLREFEEVDRYYREAIDAMNAPEPAIAPVQNSADVTVSFQLAPAVLDWNRSHI